MSTPSLPPPDDHGHFWFGKPGTCVPAILKFSDGNAFMLSMGERGMHWTDGKLTRFRKPTKAMVMLQNLGVFRGK